MKQFINTSTGEFTINNGFIVSEATSLTELKHHFGEDKLKEGEYFKNLYISSQVILDNLYFKFIFHFEDELLKRISFEIEESEKPREPWGNNRDFETNWIASQTNDDSGFIWDMNKAGRHYHRSYPWGSVGVYYDFKNGTFESSLNYTMKY